MPYKPEYDEVKKNLERYFRDDEDFIEREFKRLANGYNAFNDAMNKLRQLAIKLEDDSSIAYEGSTYVVIDENTTVSIAVKR